MWIGTNSGLNRYDGSSFIQYSVLSQPALSNSTITALTQDPQGLIWIGTENGLNILDRQRNSIRQFIHDDRNPASLPFGPIRVIQKMRDGSTWVLGDKWAVAFSDCHSFSKIDIQPELVKHEMVFTGLTEHAGNLVWLSYLDQVTTLAERTSIGGKSERISKPILFANDYARVHTDHNGITWGISCYGIQRFNVTARRFEAWLKNEYITNIPKLHLRNCYTIDDEENIWQGNERGSLVKYDLVQKKVSDYSWLLSNTNATLVYCIYKDNSNNIWAGTDNGIIKISNRFSIFTNIPFRVQGQDLKNIRCRRIMSDRHQTLYAATESYGLLKKMKTSTGDTTIALSTYGAVPISDLPFTNNSLKIHLTGKYDIGYMYDLWYDQEDIIWMVGFGIGRYDTRTDSLEIFLSGNTEQARLESINQYSICFDGKLFWTSGEHNMFTFDPVTHNLQPFVDNKGNMPFKEAASWGLVRNGDWIVAGTVNGLFKVNIYTHEVIKLALHPALGNRINDIIVDADSSYWVSTAGAGIIHCNERTGYVKQYTNRDGLSSNTVCGILRDDKNDLWVSTYAGLNYFNRQTQQFTAFYEKDGLNANEFNRKALARLDDGRMIFGGLNGYMIFNPAEAFRSTNPVKILLTRFRKTSGDGENIETIFNSRELKEVTISPSDKFFSFDFALSDMYDPSGNRFFYLLEGVDDEWRAIGNQHTISFSGLSPGNYTLRVKGHVGKGAASENELVIAIHVKRAFYKTAWFFALVGLLAASIIYLIVRYRIHQVKKIQYLRTRIASDLHDEVGSSLVRITVLADAAKREMQKGNANDQLGTIAGISRNAVSMMKDVIWSIDSRNDTMGGMLQHMLEHLHNMLLPANIDFELQHQGLQEEEKLEMNFRQDVYLTFKEAINNVVKHSNAGKVKIDIKKDHHYFTLQIRDDGKGLNGRNGNGHGLHNMQLRAERLKAQLEMISDKGLLISLKVPV
jgi:ligand-binding sensor domain-containing protein/two-component sensor histidine kinase